MPAILRADVTGSAFVTEYLAVAVRSRGRRSVEVGVDRHDRPVRSVLQLRHLDVAQVGLPARDLGVVIEEIPLALNSTMEWWFVQPSTGSRIFPFTVNGP